MAKKVVLTIGQASFLVPDDQAEKLGILVEQVSLWFPVTEGEGSWAPRWNYKADEEVKVSVSFVDEAKLNDGRPKAAPKKTALEEAPI